MVRAPDLLADGACAVHSIPFLFDSAVLPLTKFVFASLFRAFVQILEPITRSVTEGQPSALATDGVIVDVFGGRTAFTPAQRRVHTSFAFGICILIV